MRDNRGFVLIAVLLLLLLLAVTAVMLNSRAGLQSRMSANQTQSVQNYLNQLSLAEKTIWKLKQNPGWRPIASDPLSYNGATGTIGYSETAGYTDAVTISASLFGKTISVRSLRYFIDTPLPFMNKKPIRVTADAANNIYFADMDNHCVWKVDAAGAVTRFAGDGTSGTSDSQLNSPQGVCFSGGNIYIADTANHRIMKVAAGVMTVYAGTTGVYGSSDGARLSATFNTPKGISIDSTGNLYVADSGNNMIRKVTSAGVVRIAGTGTAGATEGNAVTAAQFKGPSDVVKNSDGYLYVADSGNNKLRKVVEGGDTSTVTSMLIDPRSVAADSLGNLYVADTGNSCIRKIANPSTSPVVSTYAGTLAAPGYFGDGGSRTSARLYRPMGVCANGTSPGDIVIADTINCTLRRVAASTGTISTVGPQASIGLDNPTKIVRYFDALARKPYIYIADTLNHRILRFDIYANAVEIIAGSGVRGYSGDGCTYANCAKDATFDSPQGIALDSTGIYVADTNNCVLRKIDTSGKISLFAGKDGDCSVNVGQQVRFKYPTGLSKRESSYLYVADTENNRVLSVNTKDHFAAVGTGFSSPKSVWLDASGKVYVADSGNHRIVRMNGDGSSQMVVAGTGTAGYSGDGGTPTAAQLNYPTGVSTDGTSFLILDTGNRVIRLIDGSPSKIRTVGGMANNWGFNGDNRAAVTAWISVANSLLINPTTAIVGGIAVSWGDSGSVYGTDTIHISDTGNNRIRVLSLKKAKELY